MTLDAAIQPPLEIKFYNWLDLEAASKDRAVLHMAGNTNHLLKMDL
jgi:hypothetical protein